MSKSTKWHRRVIIDGINAILGVCGIFAAIITICGIASLLLNIMTLLFRAFGVE